MYSVDPLSNARNYRCGKTFLEYSKANIENNSYELKAGAFMLFNVLLYPNAYSFARIPVGNKEKLLFPFYIKN